MTPINQIGRRRQHSTDRRILAILLCLFFSSADALSKHLPVSRLNSSNGLTQNTIKAITQDHTGFMWFATQDGLHRYDGISFKVFRPNPDDPAGSIISNSVNVLWVDSQGHLWAGSALGLSLYDPIHERFQNYTHSNSNSISGNYIDALFEDDQGRLWIGTDRRGLNLFNQSDQSFQSFRHDPSDPNSLSSDHINAIFQDRQGTIWLGNNYGLDAFDAVSGQAQRLRPTNASGINMPDVEVSQITEDLEGTLWVGTAAQGLYAIDSSRQNYRHYSRDYPDQYSLSGDEIASLLVDRQGQLWVGTFGQTLNQFDRIQRRFIHYNHDPINTTALSDDRIISMHEDRSGIVWLGTYRSGINKVDQYQFPSSIYDGHSHDFNKDIRAFLVDRLGSLWVGSESDGIRIIKAGGQSIRLKQQAGQPQGLISNRIITLMEDRHGMVWIGDSNGLLYRYHPTDQSLHRYSTQAGSELRHGRVRALLEDHAGTVWVGVDGGGIHRFNPDNGTFTHFHHDEKDPTSIPSDRVFSMREDRQHNIWVATFGGGLSRFDRDSGKFTHFRHNPEDRNSLGSEQLLSIQVDEYQDVLWLGMQGGGFDRFDLTSGGFTHYTKSDGLPNNTVYGILQEDENTLWLSTNQGLSRFTIDSKKFRNYDVYDGLKNNEFNGGAYYKSKDGRMFFGGISGYNSFHPKQIVNNRHPPPVVFTGMTLFNRPVSAGLLDGGRQILERSITYADRVTLSHRDYMFSFEFAALDYARPGKNQYAYMMEGLEDDWNIVDNRSFAAYTTLPPGHYKFRVKASNNHGLWNQQGIAIDVTITPPFWQTWWFRFVVLLVLAKLILVIYRWRVKRIRTRNLELERVVKVRTGELEEQKVSLESALTELNDTKDALVEAAHKAGMAETATGVLHNVGNLLNSVSVSAGLIQDRAAKPILHRLTKINDMLREHRDDLSALLQSPKGVTILEYFLQLELAFREENGELRANSKRLQEKIGAIKDAIADQQRYARGSAFVEQLSLQDLVEETLRLQAGSIDRHGIRIETSYQQIPKVKVQKTKVVQILLNLYKNAKESMEEARQDNRCLHIAIWREQQHAYVQVSDNGIGIDTDQLQRIFAYGCTSKAEGHGFGLHSAANYMTEMRGRIWADSQGHGHGASFTLEFPIAEARALPTPTANAAA